MTPIGVIHSPFYNPAGMPIQSTGAVGISGTIEIFPQYQEALTDLDEFDRIILLYFFHQTTGWSSMVTPYLDKKPHGVLATRAPRRPNPIGLSIVRLTKVTGMTLEIADVDILDGTPLLDIKPYIPAFDAFPKAKAGWMEHAQHQASTARSDARFHEHPVSK